MADEGFANLLLSAGLITLLLGLFSLLLYCAARHKNEAEHRVCGQILSERLKKAVEICGKKRGQPLF